MNLSESNSSIDDVNNLPSIVLPPPTFPNMPNNNNTKITIVMEIKRLIKDMSKSKQRTTNFASIEYLVQQNFQKILLSKVILKLRNDFNSNNIIFLNSKTKKPFESELKLIRSINSSIHRNSAFIVERKSNEKYISLNLKKVLEYLKKMYDKYISEECDIASISSAKSKTRKNYTSEKKTDKRRYLGNKTMRKRKSINVLGYMGINSDESFESLDVDSNEKSISEYKYLKDNLKGKPENKGFDTNDIDIDCSSNNNSKQKRKKKKNNKSKEKEGKYSVFKKEICFNEINDKSQSSFEDKKELQNSINIANKSNRIIEGYKNNLKSVINKVEQKEQKIEQYDKDINTVKQMKKNIEVLFQIMDIKLGILRSSKNTKYYGEAFEKIKMDFKSYKLFTKDNIKKMKNKLEEMQNYQSELNIKKKEIINELNNLKIIDDNVNYFGKNDIKKNYCNLCKKIEEHNKIKKCEQRSNDNNNRIMNNINNKFEEICAKFDSEKKEL